MQEIADGENNRSRNHTGAIFWKAQNERMPNKSRKNLRKSKKCLK
ncbi:MULTISPECIES: hypothetical protein [Cyanophyceae]|nr:MULTISPECIES: hypothetical protein [Cyanophyceae]